MGDEVRVVPEALPAVRAAEGPLLCVCALVPDKSGAGLKPLPTLPTLVGLLPSVDPLVMDQEALPSEAHPTL